MEDSKKKEFRKSVDFYTLTTHAMQSASLHVQISKNQTRLLYIAVTNVAVCATDSARLMDGLLVNSKYRRKYVNHIISRPVIGILLLLLQ